MATLVGGRWREGGRWVDLITLSSSWTNTECVCTVCISDLRKFNLFWQFNFRPKPIFAIALATPKILFVTKVLKSDLKIRQLDYFAEVKSKIPDTHCIANIEYHLIVVGKLHLCLFCHWIWTGAHCRKLKIIPCFYKEYIKIEKSVFFCFS